MNSNKCSLSLLIPAPHHHHSTVDRLHLEQDECLQAFENYKKLYAETLVDLSMKEGLGKKFGAPRRHAQEALRSEVNRSTSSENEINEYLNIIDAIGAMSMPTTFREKIQHSEMIRIFAKKMNSNSGGGGGDEIEMSPEEVTMMRNQGPEIDMVLLCCLLCLRTKMLRRGRYLSALRDAIEIPVDEPLPPSPVSEDAPFDQLYVFDLLLLLLFVTLC